MPNAATGLRAVVYARVSTDQQAEYGFSLAQQKDDLVRMASKLNAELVDVIEDAGLSGALYHGRPGLQKVLTLLKQGAANVLLVHSTSRLSRNREHQSIIRREIEQSCGKLMFFDMPVEDTPEGDLMLNIRGDFDVYERQVFRKRSKNGKLRQAKEGLQPARRFPPYGYYIVTKIDVLTGAYASHTLGKYQIVEDQAQWVREIFQRYAGGHSLRKICQWLHDNGVSTPRDAKHWHAKSLSDILKNPIHKGKAVFNKHESHSQETQSASGYKRSVHFTTRPEEEWVFIDAPPLVDEDTWDTCQERFGKNKEQYGGNPDKKYLLVGLMKCPTCSRRMGGKQYNETKTSPVRRYYRCREFHRGSNPLGTVCNTKHHNADFVDGLITQGIASLVSEPDVIAAAFQTYQETVKDTAADDEHETIRRAIESLNQEENATVKAQVEGIRAGASSAVYNTLLADIAKRRKDLESKLDAVIKRVQTKEKRTDPMQEALYLASELSAVLRVVLDAPDDVVTVADKNRLLSHVIKQIIPHEREVEGGKSETEGYEIEMAPLQRGKDGHTVTLTNAFVWWSWTFGPMISAAAPVRWGSTIIRANAAD